MKKKLSRVFAAVIAVVMAAASMNFTALASESATGELFNHGTISITSEDATEDYIIALEKAGDTASIAISPFAHMQWLGCGGSYCPDYCGTGCFVVGYGCSCFTDNTLRTATVTVTVEDESVVTAKEATADGDVNELTAPPQTMDGTVVLTAVGEGETTVTVTASLCDWVSSTIVFTVGVGKEASELTVPQQVVVPDAGDTNDTEDDEGTGESTEALIGISDYEAWTYYDEETQVSTLYLNLTYPEEMKIVDQTALLSEINIKVGSTDHTVTSATLSEDGKTLQITTSGWGAGQSYRLVSTGKLSDLVSVSTGTAADSFVIFYVPSGPTLNIQEQTVATEDTNASITTTLVKEEGTSRGMVHFILLKNGEPATELTENGATATSHFHDLSYTAEEFVANAAGETGPLQVALGNDYTVSYDGATITITAVDSEPGDVLDLHIVSYLNTNNANVDKSALQELSNQAKQLVGDDSSTEAEDLNNNIIIADVILSSGYYAQTDVDYAAAELEAAMEAYSTVLPESEHNYANSTDETWTYTLEGAENGIYVTFSEDTYTESGYDYIYIYDGEDNLLGTYTGDALAGATVYVPTSTVKIRLTSDSSAAYYGFAVTGVEAASDAVDISIVGSADDIAPVALNGKVQAVVMVGSTTLAEGTDYTITYDSSTVGTYTATITGTGKYTGTLTAEFSVYDPDDESSYLDGATVYKENILLRQSGDTGTSYIQFEDVPGAWMNSITSITFTPVDSNGTPTNTGNLAYPYAPKEITLTADDLTFSGNYIYFNRTAEDPVVYVMSGHEPIEITSRWSVNTYPQSQVYVVTIEATGYKTTTGTVTYYTGTAPDFSIIIDEDGDASTTDDQVVAYTWTAEELEELATFANGSSQCSMTGFRTFTTEGVSLKTLLEIAGVEVLPTDSYLLDTSDHYGNTFTYEELFGTTRYFLAAIYDEEFAEIYQDIVETDSSAGSTIELRRYLAEQALEDESVIEPRISTKYVESYIYADELEGLELPTEENTTFNSLVAYENQFRFTPGIPLVQEKVTVTFDSQGGSEVESQTVLTHWLTSTTNTTWSSSYWANSLVIYRNAAEETEDTGSDAAETIAEPETPTREGYVFAGWYTDEECTEIFDFTADDGTVDVDTTLYAKWVEEDAVISLEDFELDNAEHDDEDAELNQTIVITLTFDDDIVLSDDFDPYKDLYITIAGGDVRDTDREISAEVVDGNKLQITLTSTDWVAIYGGILTVSFTNTGYGTISGSGGEVVQMDTQTGRIPIGITLENSVKTATADEAAATYVNVTHKANMRGMYSYSLISIDADGNETEVYTGTSHAHNFYSSITRESIASAMASGIDSVDGYSVVYADGTDFVVCADEAVAGQTLVVRMVELDASDTLVSEHSHVGYTTDDGTFCAFCGEQLTSVTGITFDVIGAEIATGGTLTIGAKVYPEDAYDKDVTWTSSDESVAVVDENGVVTALTYGTAVITATTEDGGYTASCTIQTRFYDVTGNNSSKAVFNAVYWGTDNGIIEGFDGGVYFGPEQNVTREQTVIMLYRLAGSPDVDSSIELPFTDTEGMTAGGLKALKWAYQNGLVKGYSDGTFGPQNDVTREEITILLYRLDALQGREDTNDGEDITFTDADEIKSTGGQKAIDWAVKEGIIKGYSGDKAGCFGPQDNCLRQQLVIMLMRYAGEA